VNKCKIKVTNKFSATCFHWIVWKMSTKALADALGVTRRKLRPLVQQQSAAAAVDTTGSKRQRSTKKSVVTSVVAADPCKPQVRRVGLSVQSTTALPSTVCDIPSEQQAAVPVVSASSDARQFGQCTHCLRVLSLTTVGLLHSHGHGCPGSGQLPVAGSLKSVSLCPKRNTPSSLASPDLASTSSSANQSQSPSDIMEMLRQCRCRVLKRVPKASRIPAAEKLAGTLQQVLAHPDYVSNWTELFLFSFSCFGVPGQRGGKRHLSSLASKLTRRRRLYK
jgi:hypothetical protein